MNKRLNKKLSPIYKPLEYIWVDGKFKKYEEISLSPMVHSLHYSGAVYEGERSYQGEIFKLKEHSQRLVYSAASLGLDLEYNAAEIEDITKEFLKINKVDDAYIRPIIFRDNESIRMYHDDLSTRFFIMGVSSSPNFKDGLKVNISKWRKSHPLSLDPEAKSSAHYATAILAKKEAQKKGFDDSICLDLGGNIAECTVSNIFFASGSHIVTPMPGFFLNGITRQFVINMAKDMGFTVEETKLSLDDIDKFDSCFITGTAVEIAGVSCVHIDQIVEDSNISLQGISGKIIGKGESEESGIPKLYGKTIKYDNPVLSNLQQEFARVTGRRNIF